MRLFWIVIGIVGFALFFIFLRQEAAPNSLARFSYLGLVGLAAASWLLGSGLRLGQFLHYSLIWSTLILVLLLGYNHRYQLQDLGHQLTMGLVPAGPLSRTAENSTSVTLRRAPNGHFETHVLVNNQATILFMLDTGASSVVLSYEDARRAGLEVEDLRFSITTNTANGEAQAAPVRLQSLKIGDIERNNLRALVARPQALSDSLLGMNFLNSLSGYNVRADQLTLID